MCIPSPHSHIPLLILHTQDIPFLVLAGYFTQQTKALHVSAFFTLSVSLLGVVAYFGYLVVERGNIQGYFGCLKGEALDAWTKFRIGGGVVRPPAQEPSPATSSLPQRPHRSPYGSSESEHSDDSQVCGEERSWGGGVAACGVMLDNALLGFGHHIFVSW